MKQKRISIKPFFLFLSFIFIFKFSYCIYDEFTTQATPESPINITAEEILDYDTENEMIYAKKNVVVTQKDMNLTADMVIIDLRLKELQASGNVFLQTPKEMMKADRLMLNLDTYKGVAYDTKGESGKTYFKAPELERLSEKEAFFRDTDVTSCEFEIPHYFFRAKQIQLEIGERFFAKSAVLYVRNIPVMFFPVYTKSLKEGSPWHFQFGYGSRVGAYARVFYSYHHKKEYEDEMYNRGHLTLLADVLSKRGIGKGLRYDYKFWGGRYRGLIDIYQIDDKKWEEDEKENSFANRWKVNIKQRLMITKDLYAQLVLDMVSDSHVYKDFFSYSEEYRGRVAERSGIGAITLNKEAFIARISGSFKDRLTRDKRQNFIDPSANDNEWDDIKEDSFDVRRYGRISQKAPEFNFATRYLNIKGTPFWFKTELKAINALDPGFNFYRTSDDAYLRGIDIYNIFMYRLKLSEKYTFTAKFGLGANYFQRSSDELDFHFMSHAEMVNATYNPLDPNWQDPLYQALKRARYGMIRVDDNSVLIGNKVVSYDDIDEITYSGDITLRLQARFNPNLTGEINYMYRKVSGFSYGDFQGAIGNYLYPWDVFSFRTDAHIINAYLKYFNPSPYYEIYGGGGINLQGKSDITPNENLYFAFAGFNTANKKKTRKFSIYSQLYSDQIRDPSDEFNFQRDTIVAGSSVGFNTPDLKYYALVDVFYIKYLNKDPLKEELKKIYHWMDDEDDYDKGQGYLSARFGLPVGEKYRMELVSRVDLDQGKLERQDISISRDLHDWVANLLLSYEFADEIDKQNKINVQFSLMMKEFPGRGLGRTTSVAAFTEPKKESIDVYH